MKAVFLSATLSLSAFASSLESSIDSVSLPNAHWVDHEDEGSRTLSRPMRGSQPRTKAQAREIVEAGVSDVLIFKKLSRGETVEKEVALFEAAGLEEAHVRHIAFEWKDLEFSEGCKQVIEALQVLKQVEDDKGNLFFHCSLGEDRTGLLAGLYQVVRNGKDARAAFEEDMCAHGYADGHPTKPGFVAAKVHAALTPLFVKLAEKARDGSLSWDDLDDKVCGRAARVEMQGNWRCPQPE
jgi:hypothetical protein